MMRSCLARLIITSAFGSISFAAACLIVLVLVIAWRRRGGGLWKHHTQLILIMSLRSHSFPRRHRDARVYQLQTLIVSSIPMAPLPRSSVSVVGVGVVISVARHSSILRRGTKPSRQSVQVRDSQEEGRTSRLYIRTWVAQVSINTNFVSLTIPFNTYSFFGGCTMCCSLRIFIEYRPLNERALLFSRL